MPASDKTHDEAITEAVETVLRPLIEADGGGVDLVEHENGVVRLRLSGKAAFSVGGQYIRTLVIEPLIRAAGGEELRVIIEDATTRPSSQEIAVADVLREIAAEAPLDEEQRKALAPAGDADGDESADAEGADDAESDD